MRTSAQQFGWFSAIGLMLGLVFAYGGLAMIAGALGLILGLVFLIYCFKKPEISLKMVLIFSFFAIGLTRYIDAPIGLGIDFLLVLTWISVTFYKKTALPWSNCRQTLVLFQLVWFLYLILQLFNPESLGIEPWFYAMRGMALYPLLIIPLILMLFQDKKDLNWFIKMWLFISLLAAGKAFLQKYVGCDRFEQTWLNQGGAITHVLFGQLRTFSFYSDAGQFGAAMAHASLSSFILATGPYRKSVKLLLFVLFLVFFWAYLLSGTRGAIAVFATGLLVFLLLSKNFKILIWGGILGFAFYFFMAFTTIGQGNNEIRRLRTAFTQGSEDESMLVRKANQAKLKVYLADKPFGGGVGSAGDWGKRFHPNSALAQIATDSFYVRIWAETGIVGLSYMVLFFSFILIRGVKIVWSINDVFVRNKLIALYSGVIGIMVASYSNSVFSQFPSSMICYTSICFLFIAEKKWIEAIKTP